MKKIYLFIPLLLLLGLKSFAQDAAIRGQVTDAATGEEIPGVNIRIEGTMSGSTTDFDGKYSINKLKPGVYNLIFSFISYQAEKIKDVVIDKNQVLVIDVKLREQAVNLKEVQVVAKSVKHTEAALLTMQRKSASVVSGISSQEMSKIGASNAAGALQKVTGVTVQDGKYVYVRGLSDRYGKTTLNGADIPGLDPERNTVQMDIFPANIIDNILVYKSFRPDLPSDFTGGLVDIRTKDIPDKYTFNFSMKTGFNPQSNFKRDFPEYKGGKFDFLGFDDGTRAIPSIAQGAIPARFENNDKLNDITKSFNKTWIPQSGFSGLNQKYTLGIGNQKVVAGKDLGFFVGGSYSHSYKSFDDGAYGRYKLTDKDASELSTEYQSTIWKTGSKNTVWSLLGGLGLRLNSSNNLSFNTLVTTSSRDFASYAGFVQYSDDDKPREKRVLSFNSRHFIANQLRGKHMIEKVKGLKLEWLASYVLTIQNEPDVRYLINDVNVNGSDTTYYVDNSSYSLPRRFYRDLHEQNAFARMDFTYDFGQGTSKRKTKIKFGMAYSNKYREYFQKTISFGEATSQQYVNISDYFNDGNIDAVSGVYAQNSKRDDENNSYTGSQIVSSAYLMCDVYPFKKSKVVIGVRVENTFMQTQSLWQKNNSQVFTDGDVDGYPVAIKTLNVLPSLNFTYSPREKTNLRFAYNRTVARPSFREKSTVQMENKTGDIIIGNPALQQTLIDNIDLRWEKYFKARELVTFGAFYKRFINPIEKTFNTKAQNPEITWRNVDKAFVYGLETDFGKNLNFMLPVNNFFFRTNISYILSRVSIDSQELGSKRYFDPEFPETRTMFEQSPWIVNAVMSYASDSSGLSANLSFTYNAGRLSIVNPNGIPDVYQKAFYDLYFNISKKAGKHFLLSFEVKNILNSRYTKTYTYKGKEYIYDDFAWGREFAFKIAYAL